MQWISLALVAELLSSAVALLPVFPPHPWATPTSLESAFDGSDPASPSVGDYVQGVHGGKYQFDDARVNSIGRDFAEALYSGGSSEACDEDDEEPMPRWAQNLGTFIIAADCSSTLTLVRGGAPVTVEIRNDERTWERFYVKVLGEESLALSIQYEPVTGKLAPRGGSVNLCDPSRPYSDAATITIRRCPEVATATSGELVLAIGTEEEQWYYKLVIP